MTNLPLDADDLKRDFSLKLEIDSLVDSKLKVDSEKVVSSKLIHLSVFKQQNECTDDDMITDEMMMESAFDKGSNTCKKMR